jgi:hypothetical protein
VAEIDNGYGISGFKSAMQAFSKVAKSILKNLSNSFG